MAGGGGGERGGAGVVAASWRGIFGRVMAVRARDLVAIRGAPCALPASLVYPFLHGPFNLPPLVGEYIDCGAGAIVRRTL